MTFDEFTEFCEKMLRRNQKQWWIYIVKFWTRPHPQPSGFKLFQFHAIFGKLWQNCMLPPPYQHRRRPHLWEILDPPLKSILSADLLSGNLMSYQSTTDFERIFKILPRFMYQ